MKDLIQFSTAKLGNEGVKIDLTDADGKPTKHWIKILSIDSTAFKVAQAKFRKAIVVMQENSPEGADLLELNEDSEKETRRLLASLVVGWSFRNDDGTPYDCNQVNVMKVLKDAPILATEIDEASVQRKNFIKSN